MIAPASRNDSLTEPECRIAFCICSPLLSKGETQFTRIQVLSSICLIKLFLVIIYITATSFWGLLGIWHFTLDPSNWVQAYRSHHWPIGTCAALMRRPFYQWLSRIILIYYSQKFLPIFDNQMCGGLVRWWSRCWDVTVVNSHSEIRIAAGYTNISK